MTYKSIDDTAVAELKNLSTALDQRIDNNSRAAFEDRGRAASAVYDLDNPPELSASASLLSTSGPIWMVVPYLWVPSKGAKTIQMRVRGIVLDDDVEVGYKAIPVARIPAEIGEPVATATLVPGLQRTDFDIDITEVNSGQPIIVYLFVKGKSFATEEIMDGGNQTFDGWSINWAEFAGYSGTWADANPHQFLEISATRTVGGKLDADEGYFPYTRRIIRRENGVGGSNLIAYVWPPYAAENGANEVILGEDEGTVVFYSRLKLEAVTLRETEFEPIAPRFTSINTGQNPHTWPHREMYRRSEAVFNRGRVHCMSPAPNLQFLDRGFAVNPPLLPIKRDKLIVPVFNGPTATIACGNVFYDDQFYRGREGQRYQRADVEFIALVGMTYVKDYNTSSGDNPLIVPFDFQVKSMNIGGGNVFTTDAIQQDVTCMPIARGRYDPIIQSNPCAYLLHNMHTFGPDISENAFTQVAHGLSDGFPADVFPTGQWHLIRIRVQDTSFAFAGFRRLELQAELSTDLFLPTTGYIWHVPAILIVDTVTGRPLDLSGPPWP